MTVNVQSKEIERRLMSFRRSKEYDAELKGKTVVLVDDGIATGATMLAHNYISHCYSRIYCSSDNDIGA